jgi:selenide, water dikinase
VIRERESIKTSTVSTIQVIGGGAAAVEIALALAHRWRAASVERKIGIVSAEPLLRAFPAKVRASALKALAAMRVSVVETKPVASIEPTHLTLVNGNTIPCQISILATGYSPSPLIASIDIAKADDGSISINSGLQSRSHKNIFAVGDCATNPKSPLPKSGVFAVRQGPLLFDNLARFIRGEEIASFEFKQEALALISLGDKRAIAVRNGLTATGGWVWRWKDRIDRQWIARYT